MYKNIVKYYSEINPHIWLAGPCQMNAEKNKAQSETVSLNSPGFNVVTQIDDFH